MWGEGGVLKVETNKGSPKDNRPLLSLGQLPGRNQCIMHSSFPIEGNLCSYKGGILKS